MTDLTVPKRWIEGHIVELDDREVDELQAALLATNLAEQLPHLDELEQIRSTRKAWREVLLRCIDRPTHHRTREH